MLCRAAQGARCCDTGCGHGGGGARPRPATTSRERRARRGTPALREGDVIDSELVAVAALRAGASARALERWAGPLGEAVRRLHAELSGASADERTRRVARVLAEVASPVPASARAVDREWLAVALAAEPEAASVLTAPSQQPASVWLARRAFGCFPRTASGGPELAAAASWLRRRGALALAQVVRERRATVAAALAQLAEGGDDSAAELAAAVRRLERGEVEGPPRRAAVAACHGVELRRPEALALIGVAASRPELVAAAERWAAMVVGLPRAVGLAVSEVVARALGGP